VSCQVSELFDTALDTEVDIVNTHIGHVLSFSETKILGLSPSDPHFYSKQKHCIVTNVVAK